MKYVIHFLLFCFTLTACETTTSDTLTTCEVAISLDVEHGLPGDEVTAVGTPLSTTYDSIISFDGSAAEILDVSREDCALCDTCREENACAPCGACIPCLAQCNLCDESISFVIPQVPTGDTTVTLINAFGTSLAVPFQIDRHPN